MSKTTFLPPYTPGILVRMSLDSDYHHGHFHSYNKEKGDAYSIHDVMDWGSFLCTPLKRIVLKARDPDHPLREIVAFVNTLTNEVLAADIRDYGYVTYGLRKPNREFDTGVVLSRVQFPRLVEFDLTTTGTV